MIRSILLRHEDFGAEPHGRWGPEFTDILNSEYEAQVGKELELRRQTLEEDASGDAAKLAGVDKDIAERKAKFVEMSVPDRIEYLTNNFRFWLPGGWKRAMLAERKAAGITEEVEADEKMVADTDAAIAELGYDPTIISETLAAEDIRNRNLLEWTMNIFLKMYEKGYDPSQLRT